MPGLIEDVSKHWNYMYKLLHRSCCLKKGNCSNCYSCFFPIVLTAIAAAVHSVLFLIRVWLRVNSNNKHAKKAQRFAKAA